MTVGGQPCGSGSSRATLVALGLVASASLHSCITPVVVTPDIRSIGLYQLTHRPVQDGRLSEAVGVGLCSTRAGLSLGFQRVRILTLDPTPLGSELRTPWLHVWTGQVAEAAVLSQHPSLPIAHP